MRVTRFDRGSLRKPEKLPNGWLRCDAYLTRAGVFVYRNPDGTERREYRPEEEVFRSDSMQSFAGVPVTDDHPPRLLDAENTREYLRGVVSDTLRRDGDLMRASITVYDAALIAEMEAGKTEISCGYSCDIEETPGEHNGERYDAIQRNITGNHVSIVDLGRAGPEVRVRMDAAVMLPEAKQEVKSVKVRIDEIEYEFSETAGQAVQKKLEELDKKIASLQGDVEKEKARADAAEEKAAKAEARADSASDPKKIAQLVKARVALEVQARGILGEHYKTDDGKELADLSDKEIKVKVLQKLNPEIKLDDKNEHYIQARFDIACEEAAKRNPALENVNRAAHESRSDAGDVEEAARKRNKAWSANAWKAKEE